MANSLGQNVDYLLYDGPVTGAQFAVAQPGIGERFWVESSTAAKVTAVGGATRTVRVAAGRIGTHGVITTINEPVEVEIPEPPSPAGTVRYYTVAARSHHATEETTLVAPTALVSTSRTIAAAREYTPGTLVDHPLAVVKATNGSNDVQVVDDLRAVGGHGHYEATSTLALDYLDFPGTVVRIGGTVYECRASGAWEVVEEPSTDTDWSTLTLATGGYSGTARYRRRNDWGAFQAQLSRTGVGGGTNVDLVLATIPADARPSQFAYGTAWVNSNSYRAYVSSTDGTVHAEPFTISSGQNFQVYITWPVG